MSDTEVFFNGEAGDELLNYNICEVGIVYKQKHTVYLFLRDFNSASCGYLGNKWVLHSTLNSVETSGR